MVRIMMAVSVGHGVRVPWFSPCRIWGVREGILGHFDADFRHGCAPPREVIAVQLAGERV